MAQGLLEREGPLAELRAALEAARDGHGSTRLITGAAGIGKTTLLDSLKELGPEQGSQVLGAQASTLDHGFAFGIVHQLLDPLRRNDEQRFQSAMTGAAERAAVLFGPAATETDPEHGVLSGLYWLLANLAEEKPLVLRIDDLQWADEASLRFLEYLGRRIEDLPVMVAATIRTSDPGADSEMIVALAGSSATRELALEPLGQESLVTILAATLDSIPAERFVDAAWEATRGNPLLATVLAREAADRGLTGNETESEGLVTAAAAGIAPMITRRMRALPDDAIAVARIVSILGPRARRDDLLALSGLDAEAVSEALARLADADLLEPGGSLAFRHPLVQAGVAGSIPRRERELLHRNAAIRLRERGARPAEVALHWLATSPAEDPMAAEDLHRAAEEASAEGAISTAIDLLGRAIDEGCGPDDERARMLLKLATMELRILRPEGPARMREALAAGITGDDAAAGRLALGKMLMLADPATGLKEIDTARRETGDPGLRLRTEAVLMEALVLNDAASDERHSRYEAIRMGGSPSVVELAHLASEEALAGKVPASEVAELARRASDDGVLLSEVGPEGATWNLLTHALRFAERPAEAARLLRDGDRVVRKRGLRAAGTFVDQSWAYWHRDFGSAARGLAHARTGYDSILEAGLPISVWSLTSIMAENMVLLDQLAEADALVDEPLGPARNTFVEPFALTARGYVRMVNGRQEEAEADLRRVVELSDEHGWHAPAAARGRIRLAELLALTGRPDEALALTAVDAASARRAKTSGSLGCVLRVRALAQADGERLATQRLAAEAFAASPLLADRSRSLIELGTTLRHAGELEEARAVLRQALDFASRSESAGLAAQARGELEASGGRPRRERISGLESLTPSERRVAELAVEGMTNRQIAETLWVTTKTVEYHLRNTYSKLEISSRAGLGPVLATAGGDG